MSIQQTNITAEWGPAYIDGSPGQASESDNHSNNPSRSDWIHHWDNVRRLLNIISHQQDRKLESVIISLDAQKAFNRVSWQYLFQTLKRLRFCPNFITWIQTLY